MVWMEQNEKGEPNEKETKAGTEVRQIFSNKRKKITLWANSGASFSFLGTIFPLKHATLEVGRLKAIKAEELLISVWCMQRWHSDSSGN